MESPPTNHCDIKLTGNIVDGVTEHSTDRGTERETVNHKAVNGVMVKWGNGKSGKMVNRSNGEWETKGTVKNTKSEAQRVQNAEGYCIKRV